MKRTKKRATIISTGIRLPRARNAKKMNLLKNNQKLIMLTGIFICGLFLGALTIRNANTGLENSLKTLIENYCIARGQQSILSNFLSFFGTECIFLLIALFFGVCSVGEPIIWGLPLLKGLGIGLISGYLYSEYTLQGMIYFSAFILPPSMLAAAALIFGCKESILMTRDLNRILFKGESHNGFEMLRLYALRYFVLLCSTLFAAALSAALTFLFADKINLF